MARSSAKKGGTRAIKKKRTRTALKTARPVQPSNLLDVLRRRGWSVRLAARAQKLPRAVVTRYPRIPSDVRDFLCALRRCRSPKQSAWFLGAEDFARKGSAGFRWNEIELMSLEFAEDDLERAKTRSFWDRHFPVMLAVHSDYDYLAVRISDGAIVHGFAPYWEEPSKVAPSFAALLSVLATAARAKRDKFPWEIFVGTYC